MSTDAALKELAQDYGVHLDYHGLTGQRLVAEPPTLRAILAALGVEAGSAANVAEALHHRRAECAERSLPPELILRAGAGATLPLPGACDWAVLTETGQEVQAGRDQQSITLAALPVGYFTLVAKGRDWREEVFVLSRPAHAPVPGQNGRAAKGWGVTGALYGLRSASNGGLGNYRDLATAAQALGQGGAQFFGINPVHALGWVASETISPYSPSHRGFLNTDHIATTAGLGPCPDGDLIDYAAFRVRHRAALEAEYAAFTASAPEEQAASFRRYCAAGGADLAAFARFEALSETHGGDFRNWPARLQSPDPAPDQTGRAAFHQWLQWQADRQITDAQRAARGAGMAHGLYLDLAVGPRPGGAEVWMHRDIVARGVSIGAPPDHLSPAGQSWTLAAYAPNKLAANRYQPVRAMLGKLMARAGLLRIDHALGLLRSYWLPEDGSPGAYVSQPFDALLAVIAIEADKAGCKVVGEDLGLVPQGFRERLNGSGLLSYAVWQFEGQDDGHLRPAGDLPQFSLACFGTHDTPTIDGFWYGHDIEWWRCIGWIDAGGAEDRHGQRALQRTSLRTHCGIGYDASPGDIRLAIHSGLARSPAALVSLQLDDLCGCTEAQNLPGTIDEHPNWRRRLPVPVEQLAASAPLCQIGTLMQDTRALPAPATEREPEPCPD
ncbi:MAG: 4-alpha-glucanotransferase [Rhodobacteraceae bacterium]|nr:4-alpha-glucanotransferase [Paracoccaceae bacterium]